MPRKKGNTPIRGGKLNRRGALHGGHNGAFHGSAQRHSPAAFSLADEARHTGQSDHSSWSSATKLRSQPVSFVSAGASAPLDVLEEALANPESHTEVRPVSRLESPTDAHTQHPPPDIAELTDSPDIGYDNDDNDEEDIDEAEDEDEDEAIIGPEELEQHIAGKGETHTAPEPSFYFDLKGESTQDMPFPKPTVPNRSASPHYSSSDEEVILFRGRDKFRENETSRATMSMSQIRTEIHVVEEELTFSPNPKTERKGRRSKRRNRQESKEDDTDDGIIADYIANMRETGEIVGMLGMNEGNRRDLGGPLSDESDTSEKDAVTKVQEEHSQKHVTGDNSDAKYQSGSELDDETLALLIAGQDPKTLDLGGEIIDYYSDSASSDDILTRAHHVTALEQFDLMDWELQAPRKKKKGKGARGQVNFGLSDSEMEQQLQTAFKNDRLKKAQRKQQREELRALGQLGKNAKGPEDLMVKYPGGMTMDQVADEIRSFLIAGRETVTLPPMDPNARKIIHEIANKFNIKSKSTGSGEQRRPTLYRTGRTLPFIESTFDQVIRRIRRRYLPRPDARPKRSSGQRKLMRSGGNDAAVRVRNGEIVGGSAPELGSSNRGRVMLEKMGWSNGTALGSANNKGILQPVAQTMKTNKAGLG